MCGQALVLEICDFGKVSTADPKIGGPRSAAQLFAAARLRIFLPSPPWGERGEVSIFFMRRRTGGEGAKRVEDRKAATPGFLPVGKVKPIGTILPTGRKNGAEFY